ncbi:MAG TPA: gluconate 2-dehydrogenase subunit 3 family protein [Chitinophagaceae bacterium]|nr:gluconate 2-dehydrogenase subunit 3 family protein [Chitinophagaceae bacterium]
MDRRELLKLIALATGGTVVGGELFLAGCKSKDTAVAEAGMFSENDIAFLDEVAETIIPKTTTAGAKEAEVGKFMTVMVNDCYEEADQKIFREGIKKLNEECNKRHGHSFMKADATHRKDLLVSLDKEAKDYMKNKKEGDPGHYFSMMKQLTLLGYFTSKPGLEQNFNYKQIPGSYDGAVPYKKGDKLFV